MGKPEEREGQARPETTGCRALLFTKNKNQRQRLKAENQREHGLPFPGLFPRELYRNPQARNGEPLHSRESIEGDARRAKSTTEDPHRTPYPPRYLYSREPPEISQISLAIGAPDVHARPMAGGNRSWGREGLRFASIAVLVGAAISYGASIVSSVLWLKLPLAALEVPRDSKPSDVLPAEPGELRGHNLVLVTFDTTRPDRLGLYGNRAIQTPNLDRLAAEGIVFSNALATTSTTLPTHASMMTGLYPHRHGARVNSRNSLPTSVPTLAEILEAEGYRTAAFVSAFVLDAKFGLDQGFDHYDAQTDHRGVSNGYFERSAARTTQAALAWLERNRKRPYFLWVHYFDPHTPYKAAIQFEEATANLYDAEIAATDYQLGRLLSAVENNEERGSRETLVVVTADHGEALGEHGEQVHGFLVQEATLRIPLIIYATEGLARGLHVPTRVSQVDLLPTLASLLGASPPVDIDGVDLTQPVDPGRAILGEAVYGQAHFNWAPISAIYRGPWKYVASPNPELYNLEQDPLERTNLVESHPHEAAALARALGEQRGPAADRMPAVTVDLEPDEIAALRALGYLAGEPAPAEGASPGAGPGLPSVSAGPPSAGTTRQALDPKSMLPLFNELGDILVGVDGYESRAPLERAFLQAVGGPLFKDQAELVAGLEAFQREHPDFSPVYAALAENYEAAGRTEDAARAKERFREILSRSDTRANGEPR